VAVAVAGYLRQQGERGKDRLKSGQESTNAGIVEPGGVPQRRASASRVPSAGRSLGDAAGDRRFRDSGSRVNDIEETVTRAICSPPAEPAAAPEVLKSGFDERKGEDKEYAGK